MNQNWIAWMWNALEKFVLITEGIIYLDYQFDAFTSPHVMPLSLH